MRDGRAHEAAGRTTQAAECYAAAAERAAREGDPRALSEALRRRGVLLHLAADVERARHLCSRAYDVALLADAHDHAAEALNALAGFALHDGRLAEASQQYRAALELAAGSPALVGKIEQNLGVLATVRRDWPAARRHYQRALAAYEETRDLGGCAFTYHNLGRIHVEQKDWDEAERRFHLCRQLARAARDVHLEGMASLGHAEVQLVLKRYADARAAASEALAIFARLDAAPDAGRAHRLLDVISRELGELDAAELRGVSARGDA